jgi:hypothetical protein
VPGASWNGALGEFVLPYTTVPYRLLAPVVRCCSTSSRRATTPPLISAPGMDRLERP